MALGFHVGGGFSTPTPAVPDGKTVTPINDVTIWQQCAGIANPTYTTLAEVLADTGILQTLMASNNAVDYLVRCKDWAGKALVPTMTSNTTPSGVVSVSSNSNNYEGWKAFNKDESSGWIPLNDDTSRYIQYDFEKSVTIQSIQTIGVGSDNSKIYTATLKGSNNGIDYVDLDSSIQVKFGNTIFNKTISNANAYRYYKLVYTNSTTGVYSHGSGMKLQLYNENLCDSSNAMTYIGQNNYASNTLLADSDWRDAICNSTYFESVLNVKVPIMTSNTTPSGECFAKDAYTSLQPYLAFNNDLNTAVHSSNYASIVNWYVGYEFTSPVKVYLMKYTISQAQLQAVSASIKLQSTNDRVTFTDNSDAESVSIPASQRVSGSIKAIKNIDEYSNYVMTSYGKGITVHECQFYGREDV